MSKKIMKKIMKKIINIILVSIIIGSFFLLCDTIFLILLILGFGYFMAISYYGNKYDKFEQQSNTSLSMLKNHHEICKSYGYSVEHFLLQRVKPYKTEGRFQNEQEAKQFDAEIEAVLQQNSIKYRKVPGNDIGLQSIVSILTTVPFHSISEKI